MPHNHTIVSVALGDRSYEIHIGCGLLANAGAMIAPLLPQPRVIVVSDEQVAAHHLPALEASLKAANIAAQVIIVPPGEGSKSFARFEWLMNELLSLTPDRKTTLVALGGGVVGDLCGFAASTLLRGVGFVQIPTTLLAQVDSSVGGKTGINAPAGKNLIGAFHQPKAVLIDTDSLHTLPDRELRAGYAEVVKYGLLGDADFWHWLQDNGELVLAREDAALAQAIERSCRAKANIVAQDEREGGVRALLNLGHTFGHSLEAECGFSDQLLHGEAVAIGMVMAANLSVKMGRLEPEMVQHIVQHFEAWDLPTSPLDIRDDWDVDALCGHFYADKKAEGGTLTFIVMDAIGKAAVCKEVDAALVRQVVEESIR